MAQEPTSETLQFGRAIRHLREVAGLRQEDVALLANVGRRFVIELEAGKPTCELARALRVAQVLGLEFSPFPLPQEEASERFFG